MEHLFNNEEKNNLIKTLTEELPSLRAKIGITQEELCQIIGISRQTYSSIETKKKRCLRTYFYLSLCFLLIMRKLLQPLIQLVLFRRSLNNSLISIKDKLLLYIDNYN